MTFLGYSFCFHCLHLLHFLSLLSSFTSLQNDLNKHSFFFGEEIRENPRQNETLTVLLSGPSGVWFPPLLYYHIYGWWCIYASLCTAFKCNKSNYSWVLPSEVLPQWGKILKDTSDPCPPSFLFFRINSVYSQVLGLFCDSLCSGYAQIAE